MDIGIIAKLIAFNMEASNDDIWQRVWYAHTLRNLVDEIGCIITVEWLGYDDPTFQVKYDYCHRE